MKKRNNLWKSIATVSAVCWIIPDQKVPTMDNILGDFIWRIFCMFVATAILHFLVFDSD